MNNVRIIAIALLGLGLLVLISTARNTSQYVDFQEAQKRQDTKGNGPWVHLIGNLVQNQQEEIIGIIQGPHETSFSFLLKDEKGKIERVWYPKPMPTDFTRAEKIVVVGRFVKKQFHAKKILLKCPSKYQAEDSVL
ncbi:MAG: cytochrome c maturation protein CcmE [Cytophagales bacterium]|nr:cytochrome c maturation protein CcmE [Cytophagales bacterium]